MSKPRNPFFSSEIRACEAIATAATAATPPRNSGAPFTMLNQNSVIAAPLAQVQASQAPQAPAALQSRTEGERAPDIAETSPPAPTATSAPMLGRHKIEVAPKAATPPSIISATPQQFPPTAHTTVAPLTIPSAPLASATIATTAGVSYPDDEVRATFLDVATRFPVLWETMVGLYLQEASRTPLHISDSSCSILQQHWCLDLLKLDRMDKKPGEMNDKWTMNWQEPVLVAAINYIKSGNALSLEATIRQWANECPDRVEFVLTKAGWRQGTLARIVEWYEVDRTLKMPDGAQRSERLAQMEQQYPRFFQFCKDDIFCGIRRQIKRKRPEDEVDCDYYYDDQYLATSNRVPGTLLYHDCFPKSPPKKLKPWKDMSSDFTGRPTQFHGVPLEERAIDSNGNRLPFALVYPDDHPKARGQKRHVEETGPFGKSTRRKGSSRLRSTVTPARKETTNLDGFERACQTSAKWEADALQENASRTVQINSTVASQLPPLYNHEPTQIMLFGYQKSREYQAIDLFERISQGVICENYPRGPPAILQKYPNASSSDTHIHPRKLTAQERKLAAIYSGGESWVKLTCESAEAAARAVENSGQQVYGYWVYAELWNGQGPSVDEPIPIQDQDRVTEGFGSARPPRRTSQSLSAAFSQHASRQQRATATLPRSFDPTGHPNADGQQGNGATSSSPSTASSATATAPEYPNLRNRQQFQNESNELSSSTQSNTPARAVVPGQYNPAMMRHFQDRPRTVLRPASEAFLPMPTYWERSTKWLREAGWIPGDFIGDTLPITATGEFDWAAASWYWRLCYWIDTHTGTDICGLKDN